MHHLRLFVLIVLVGLSTRAHAQTLSPYAYDTGSPAVTDYYIDPVRGADSRSGLSPANAWKTVQHAWQQIPQSTPLTEGYRINLMNGSYGDSELPNYWELRRGTANAPIIIQAASGQTDVRLVRDINMANVSYFYLLSVNITPAGGGDAFHCEQCDHILLRGNVFNGGSIASGAQETIKVNQSQYIFLENNNIAYAGDNNIDFVAVQYGHIIGNKVHEATDWCAYVKGGSAYIRIEGNEFYNCGTGGFTAGQGTGFQFMTAPWVHYEAYDIKFINNVIHDTQGAAFGVNGGFNILMAFNTAYRVGTRSHLIEVVFGERSCDGVTEGVQDAGCAANNAAGGWGPTRVKTTPDYIGNRNVLIANNVLYNPAGTVAPQHVAIYGPRDVSSGVNLSSPQRTDTNLAIRANVIWNGNASTFVGVEDSDAGCRDTNPSCNLTQLTSDNTINSIEPLLSAVSSGDYRPLNGGALASLSSVSLENFSGGDRPATPLSPEGALSNTVERDLSGTATSTTRPPGAYSSPSVSLSPPAIGGSLAPTIPGGGSGGGATPTLSIDRIRIGQTRKRKRVTLTVTATISGTASTVTASVSKNTRTIASLRLVSQGNDTYRGQATLSAPAGTKLSVTVQAADTSGSSSSTKAIKTK